MKWCKNYEFQIEFGISDKIVQKLGILDREFVFHKEKGRATL